MIYKKIAARLYGLFTINTGAAAIQMPDGRYVTKYIPISLFVIEAMLRQNGSMGCYQQGYYTNQIKSNGYALILIATGMSLM